MSSIRNILILRPGAIGDTLLTFPSFLLLRRHFPSARIAIIGNRPVLELGRNPGLVDVVDAFGADWIGDLFGLQPTPALRERLERYDLAIVWMHSSDAAGDLAARLAAAGVPRILALVSFPAAGSGRHVADHLVDTLSELGISGPRPPLTLRAPPPDDASATFPPLPSAPFVVLHPGAGARRKRWPAEKYAVLGERLVSLGYGLAITSGPADDEAVTTLMTALRRPPRILAGLELTDLAAVLSRASLVVGNDSGVTHLAALVGAPTVAIFGPFDPAYWAPIGPRVRVVDGGLPCSHRQDPRDGCRQCNLLPSLDVDQVWDMARALLESSGAE